MSISITLRNYLAQQGVHYEVIRHARSGCSMESAQAAHVPGDALAKGVMLEDELGYVMAVVPSTHHVELGTLRNRLRRKNLSLANEEELAVLFIDCEIGAVPPLGEAYGLGMIVDDTLRTNPDIYFEAGNHRDLVHIEGDEFQRLIDKAEHGYFSSRITQ
ncbi:MAG: YbaK/EbsC family protein [Gammaproteobacteria bacterium]|nr:YbaK/EbsC family protein [Gammaproteobacteria bacterium]